MISLFDSTETTFSTIGLGSLSDAISCAVIEERNGQFELEMVYPRTGQHWSDIRKGRIIYCKPDPYRSPQAFDIYRITDDMKGRSRVYARHISYRLSKITCGPFTASNCPAALSGLKTNAADPCPFNFTTNKVGTTAVYNQLVPRTIRECLGGVDGSILDLYLGEYEFDMFNVKLWSNRGSNRDVTIQYGKNMTDFSQEQSIAETYTGIFPYWTGIVGDNIPLTITLPEKIIYSENAQLYDVPMTLPVDFSSVFGSDPPTEEALRAEAEAYVLRNNIGVPKVSMNVSFLALRQTEEYKSIAPLERVSLCDTVNVIFEKLNVNVTAEVVKVTYDVLKDRYTSIEIGDPTSNLSTTIARQSQEITKQAVEIKSSYENDIIRATNLLKGAYGGHVVMGTNANGQPNEIFILDTESIETAVHVLRLNNNGIGFSLNGVEGPYSSAWLIDGTLDMAEINVVNLSADIIRVGVIEDAAHKNSWNLETGEIHIGYLDSNILSQQNSITELYQSIDNTTEELSSVKGSVTNISSDLADYKQEVSTTISQTSDRIEFDFDQKLSAVSNTVEENSAELSDIHKYIRFVNGNIELGEEGSPIKQVIQNDKDSFYYNGVEVAYISDNKLYITEAQILSGIVIGKHKWLARGDRMTLVYTG